MSAELDARMMRRAIELALRGQGAVEPNPMVGCVIARGETVVGEGWHQRFGGPHAEVEALIDAGPAASGSTAYVTLEPCCHTGKTPPCTAALVSAGVARVVAAVRDPNPQVDGGGIALLHQQGISCQVGVEEIAARQVLAPYLKLLATGRPWVIAKWAMTLDGKLATRTGSSKWISSPESRAIVHQLRGRMDAVIVGAGTARTDDPQLNARPAGPRNALRVVLGEITPESQLAKTTNLGPVLSVMAPRDKQVSPPPGVEGLLVEGNFTQRLQRLLDELGRRQMTNVLLEGGAQVLGTALDAGLIDEVHVFIAPKLIGGTAALSPIAGDGIADMAAAFQLAQVQLLQPGGDIYLSGRLAAR